MAGTYQFQPMNIRYVIITLVWSMLFSGTVTYAQSIYGHVRYRCVRDSALIEHNLETLKQEKPKEYGIMGESYRRSEEFVRNFVFELTFNANESISELVLEADPGGSGNALDYQMAVLSVKGNKRFYLHAADTIRLHEMSPYRSAEVFHVTESYHKFGWEITGNTKSIGNYACREAVGSITKETVCCGPLTTQITAWFAPALPFPFGPMGYDGLPGLVLEVSIGDKVNTTFQATDIDIRRGVDKSIPRLKKPGSVMTTEKFNDHATEQVKRIRN